MVGFQGSIPRPVHPISLCLIDEKLNFFYNYTRRRMRERARWIIEENMSGQDWTNRGGLRLRVRHRTLVFLAGLADSLKRLTSHQTLQLISLLG